MKLWSRAIVCLLLQSCGYHFDESVSTPPQTICIPYVQDDELGDFTAALIKEVSKSGVYQYRRSKGDLLLQASLLDIYEDNIGFRYDRSKSGKREHNIIPIETRITAVAEVSLVDIRTNQLVFGPLEISASVDFDHNYYFGSEKLNLDSLGQLTDIDAARDSVQTPLYHALAKKIVAFLIHRW